MAVVLFEFLSNPLLQIKQTQLKASRIGYRCLLMDRVGQIEQKSEPRKEVKAIENHSEYCCFPNRTSSSRIP